MMKPARLPMERTQRCAVRRSSRWPSHDILLVSRRSEHLWGLQCPRGTPEAGVVSHRDEYLGRSRGDAIS